MLRIRHSHDGIWKKNRTEFAQRMAKLQSLQHVFRVFCQEQVHSGQWRGNVERVCHDAYYKFQNIFLFKQSSSPNDKNWMTLIMQPAIPLAPSHLLRKIGTSIAICLPLFLSIPARLSERYCFCIALRRCTLRNSADIRTVHRSLFGSFPVIQ